MNFQQREILRAALADIENLAAPRHIDEVSAALGMDMVQFAKLGPEGMKQAICTRLLLGKAATASRSIADQKGWHVAHPPVPSTRN
ncbi:hypothetical protein GGE45_001647 [Rhizobium aethiopicum]|uniref:Uncharacterized protein n=1 Tax=Rhizobium aethiopicum TaxID=1138170 RepID=A0A7W6MJJ5_9HYPH|nr:hypothetical protein [Rhizobium aethiopicum]MBB4193062.1 hypothetical protein [Rhizobium aethiopicum]MBB4579323.1 hypothetical protein [Rhizobium aethiopicum]